MELYCVLVNDRHVDPSVEHVYQSQEVAVAKAKEVAQRYCRDMDDYKEDSFFGSHIVFIATYSCEGDAIYVCHSELEEGEG